MVEFLYFSMFDELVRQSQANDLTFELMITQIFQDSTPKTALSDPIVDGDHPLGFFKDFFRILFSLLFDASFSTKNATILVSISLPDIS